MTTPPLSFVDWNGATLVATSCQSVKVRRCTRLAAVPGFRSRRCDAPGWSMLTGMTDRDDFLDRVRTALYDAKLAPARRRRGPPDGSVSGAADRTPI